MAAPRSEPTAPLLRSLLVPSSLVISALLFYWVRLPIWMVVIAVSPLLAAVILAPRWARTSTEAFDRDAMRLRATGKHGELAGRFARALGMRFFAAPAVIHERHGQLLRETGDAAGATRAYRKALLAAGDPAPMPMLLGLAHSAHAAQEDDEAIGAYRRVMEHDDTLPRVRLQLAHAILRRGRAVDVDDAVALLDATPAAAGDRTEIALLRAYAEARRGRTKQARAALEEVGGVSTRVDLERLRCEIEAALSSAPSAKVSRRRA